MHPVGYVITQSPLFCETQWPWPPLFSPSWLKQWSMWEGSYITLFSPSDVTEFHRMKYGGGGSYITLFSPSAVTAFTLHHTSFSNRKVTGLDNFHSHFHTNTIRRYINDNTVLFSVGIGCLWKEQSSRWTLYLIQRFWFSVEAAGDNRHDRGRQGIMSTL